MCLVVEEATKGAEIDSAPFVISTFIRGNLCNIIEYHAQIGEICFLTLTVAIQTTQFLDNSMCDKSHIQEI